MLLKQDLVRKVRDYFSMNIYEAKVWLALLNKGVASAGEIASASGVPRSRTYDVLESLEKRGFAIAKLGKPVKYIGVKPRAIIEKLKNNVRTDAEERMVESNIKNTNEFLALESLYNNGLQPVRKEDVSVALKGRSNISNQIREIIKNAKQEVIICTDVDEMLVKSKLFVQTFQMLDKSKVNLKIALSGDDKKMKDKDFIKNILLKGIIVYGYDLAFYLLKVN